MDNININKTNNMFQVNKNDIFAKPMNAQELYATTKLSRAMKMTPFLIKLIKEKNKK